MPIFGTSKAFHEALDEPSPNPLPWIDWAGWSSDSKTPPQPVFCGPRSVFLLLCLMTFSLFKWIRTMILTEFFPDEGYCLCLHSIFPISNFRPSGNSVVPVVLMIHMSLNCLGAHPHVQTLVGRLNHSIWQVYSLRYPSFYTCLVCGDLTFQQVFEHVDAHQDNWGSYESLTRPEQMNCLMYGKSKQEIWNIDPDNLPHQEALPLESLWVFLGKEKMSSDTGARIRFWVHKQRAEEVFRNQKILLPDQFKEVDWEMVYSALHELPRMFQIWACKQVMGVAGTNLYQSKYRPNHDPKYPSCTQCVESCAHVLECQEEGRVETLLGTIDFLDIWIKR